MKPNVKSELALRGIVREADGGAKMKAERDRGGWRDSGNEIEGRRSGESKGGREGEVHI